VDKLSIREGSVILLPLALLLALGWLLVDLWQRVVGTPVCVECDGGDSGKAEP
jgi:hypothetical protein